MKNTLEFTTTVSCGSCVSKVKPVLDELAGPGNWEIDTMNPSKPLIITGENLQVQQVIDALATKGYKATFLQKKN